MAGDDEKKEQERGKTSIITADAIRLVLDKAADVDKALALIEEYDMHSVIGLALFFLTPLLSFRILVRKMKKNIKIMHEHLTKSLERYIFIITVATLSCGSAKETKSSLTY